MTSILEPSTYAALRKRIDEINNKLNKVTETVELLIRQNPDRFAEKRNLIGKLCRFYDPFLGLATGILEEIKDDAPEYDGGMATTYRRYKMKDGKWYEYCDDRVDLVLEQKDVKC